MSPSGVSQEKSLFLKIARTGRWLIFGSIPFTILFLYYLMFVVSRPFVPETVYLRLGSVAVPLAIMAGIYTLAYFLVYIRSVRGSPESAVMYSVLMGFVAIIVVFLLPLSIALWTFAYIAGKQRDKEYLRRTGHHIDEKVYTRAAMEGDTSAFEQYGRRERFRGILEAAGFVALSADFLYVSLKYGLLEELIQVALRTGAQFSEMALSYFLLFFYIPLVGFILLINGYKRYSLYKLLAFLPGREATVVGLGGPKTGNCTISINGARFSALYASKPDVGDTVKIRSIIRKSGIFTATYITVESEKSIGTDAHR